MLLKIAASRVSNYYCETEGLLREEQCGFRPARPTTAMLFIVRFVVRRVQALGRQRKSPLCVCFIDLQKAYDSVDQELLLWEEFSFLSFIEYVWRACRIACGEMAPHCLYTLLIP